jgi:integrase
MASSTPAHPRPGPGAAASGCRGQLLHHDAHLGPVGPADAYVFTAEKGGVLRTSNFRIKVWLPAVRAAGLAPLRPHDLRHAAVALWIAAGANPKEVSVRAGHTSVSFTLDRYGHLFPGHDAELRDRLDAMHAEGLQSQVT